MKGTIGAVLAGGAGSRLGGNKAAVELGGSPLISYPLAAIEEAGLEALVCAKPGEQLPPLRGSLRSLTVRKEPGNGAPVLLEPDQPRHPLCGIVAALRAGEGRPVVVVACDLPFVPAGLIRGLAEMPEPLVMPTLGDRPQPLLARYEPLLLPELEAALAREEPLVRTVESLEPNLLDEEDLSRFGDLGRILFNVNDRDDLRQAEALLAR